MSVKDLPDPPGIPGAPRRIPFGLRPWLGVLVLAVLPALALSGQFGETWQTEIRTGSALELTVRYPDRYRYKQLNSIEVRLRNVSSVTLDTVTISLDTVLVDRFSTVRSIPPFTRPWETGIADLAAGATALLIIELQAERYGRHVGDLSVFGRDTLRVPLEILIFP